MTAPTTPRRLWRNYLILAGLAVLVGVAFGVYWIRRERPANPPIVELSGADPEVAAVVESARQEVLADPRSARRWGHLGMVLRAHDYGTEANRCFEEAERLDASDPAWPYYQGLTLVMTEPKEGLSCLRRAVERMRSDELMPRFRLAEVLLEQGLYDEAEQILQSTRGAAEHLRGRLLRARLALAQQENKGALSALDGCWEDIHTRRQAHQVGVIVWQRLGESERARELQKKADVLPADVPWSDPFVVDVERLVVGVRARITQAIALQQQGQPEASIRLLEETAESYPQHVPIRILLGELYRQRRQPQEAERALREAVKLDPNHVDGWFGLGLVQIERDPRMAAEAFREVIRHKPDHTRAYYWLGVCLKNRGDLKGAQEALQQALRCEPDNSRAQKLLEELKHKVEKNP